MGLSQAEHTNPVLLERVGHDPSDQEAWETFVAHYGPTTQLWCRQRGLQAADADDVTQDVLLRLSRALRKFTYDPSRTFRGWLRSVTEHALSDFFADRKRKPGVGSGDDCGLAVLETAQAHDDLPALLNEEFTRAVVSQACAIVCARVAP